VAQDYVSEVWGVDESPHRLKDLGEVCPKAKVVMCRADRLDLPDQYFDVAVTSQMLHEVKLFGTDFELQTVLQEIKRILAAGGRYLLLDHRDAGAGDVVVKLPTAKIEQLREFEQKFQYYRATHYHIDDGVVKISKRTLQDFLTKDWSLNSPMESMEMRETHNVFQKDKAIRFIESAGLLFHKWIPFSNIREDLGRLKGELLEGEPWFRKFLLVAIKR
jgi:ubiquinone/menaquinone biosynthesis C-methylase UbiE